MFSNGNLKTPQILNSQFSIVNFPGGSSGRLPALQAGVGGRYRCNLVGCQSVFKIFKLTLDKHRCSWYIDARGT
jgi:hypothetical protein